MYVVGVGLVKVYKALIRPGLEKEMAIYSSVLALRIPGRGEPGGLPSMGLHTDCRLWGCTESDTTEVTYSYSSQVNSIHTC